MLGDAGHALDPDAAASALASDPVRGLSEAEASARLDAYGPNRPRRPGRPPYLRLVLRQFVDPLVLLLVAAAVVSIAIGDTVEGLAIAAILLANAALGFWQELAAERAILVLSGEFTHTALVVRGGIELEVPAEDVVPGDVLLISEGDRVAADGRLVEERGLELDESSLTGESLPVGKQVSAVEKAAPLAERSSMVYAGTGVTHGHGRVLVWHTGTHTELGAIERLATDAKPPPTPLERRLARLARQLVVVGVVLTVVLAAVMALRGESLHSAFLVGVAVAVAAVPEGLAATVTAALALGARELARRSAIVRRLEAIETLGETTVICTDKTGTLTENQIRVAGLCPAAGYGEHELLAGAILASRVRSADGGVHGDPSRPRSCLPQWSAAFRMTTSSESAGSCTRSRSIPSVNG